MASPRTTSVRSQHAFGHARGLVAIATLAAAGCQCMAGARSLDNVNGVALAITPGPPRPMAVGLRTWQSGAIAMQSGSQMVAEAFASAGLREAAGCVPQCHSVDTSS